MGSEFVRFVSVPIILGVLLAVLRRSRARFSIAATVLVGIGASAYAIFRGGTGEDSEAQVAVDEPLAFALFVWGPLAAIFGVSRLNLFVKAPFILVIASPIANAVATLICMFIWVALGHPW